ncbi:PP2C family serine/threonine-protein phosphatase [Mycolicibacterium sp. XJ647]
MTGREHQRRGLGCDDAYSYGIAGDFVVASVADGAGSVTGTSAWGAWVACRGVMNDAMQPAFIDSYHRCEPVHAESMIRWLFDNALNRVTKQAEALGVDPTLLSTTLCVGLADRTQAAFGQIGDGVIAAEHDGQVESLLTEAKDDYANITSFLQSERAFEESFRTAVRGDVTAFALSTDGMSYKITNMANGEAYEPFFRDSWRHVRNGASARQFAALLHGIEDDQTGDDKTMVLAAMRSRSDELDVGADDFITEHSPAPGSSATDVVVRDDVSAAESVPPKRRRRGLRMGRRR